MINSVYYGDHVVYRFQQNYRLYQTSPLLLSKTDGIQPASWIDGIGLFSVAAIFQPMNKKMSIQW